MGVRTSQLYRKGEQWDTSKSVIRKGRTMGYRHIGAQDMSQVIWQSSDRGIVGSGDEKGKRGKKVKDNHTKPRT